MKKGILLASVLTIGLVLSACGDSKKNSVNATSPLTSTDVNTLFADKPLILDAVKSVVYPDLSLTDEGQLSDFCNGMSTIVSSIDLHSSNSSFLTQAQYDYLKNVFNVKNASYQRSCF